jgi:dihydroflavonol-4-reductase
MENTPVLVTGGTGYVGGWCIHELLARGYDVRTTVRRRRANQPDGVTVFGADLTADAGWAEAMEGCAYVLHVASPLGFNAPANPEDLIVPAVEGTRRVMRAAIAAGVERVVMTSACAASQPDDLSVASVTDETLWSNPDAPSMNAYRRSKVLAERAAWEFADQIELTTILPGAVFGPVLSPDTTGSVQIIGLIASGAADGMPNMVFEVVDVRDLVDAHLRAMTTPAAAGERFIAGGDVMSVEDIADALGVSAQLVPDAVERRHRHSSAKARRLLGWHSRPGVDTVVDCARTLRG